MARAFELVNGGTDETFEETSKKAALLLRTAAAIFQYVQTRELPRWTDLPKERPPEVSIKIVEMLAS